MIKNITFAKTNLYQSYIIFYFKPNDERRSQKTKDEST